MFAALAAVAAILTARAPKAPEPHIILASVTLTGAGSPTTGAPPPPPPPAGTFDFSTAGNLTNLVAFH